MFTGSMDWLPNEDAIRYFTEQIMPRIKQAVPDVTLTVVGRDPYPGLVELSKRDPSVIVTGRVDDVRPYMEEAAVYIVPLRIGGGTRLRSTKRWRWRNRSSRRRSALKVYLY